MRRWLAVPFIAVTVFFARGAVADVDSSAERLDAAIVETAVADGRTLLAIDLLEELIRETDGWRADYYRAWILQLQGHDESAGDVYERLLAAADGEELDPAWLYESLIEQVATARLQGIAAEREADLDDVLSRHYEARCGLERLRELDDLIALGYMVVGETEVPLRLTRKRPRYYRLDLALPSGPQITATDGQAVWRIAPGQEELEGVYLSGAQAKPLLDGSWFDDVLVRYRASGESLLLANTQPDANDDHRRIEIKSAAGDRQTVFLDAETLLERRRWIWGDDAQAPAVTVATEQREFEGCQLPVRQVVETADGSVEYVIESYRFGQPVAAGAFDMDRVLEQLRPTAEQLSAEQ